MLQTVRVEKVNKKNGAISLVPMFPSRVMVLKLLNKVHFNKFVKAAYIYASESSHCTLSENDLSD